MKLVAVVAAAGAAWLAGFLVLLLRRWRNAVLFRNGQPAIRDVMMSRELIVLIVIVGAGLGLLGRRPATMILCASAPAILFVAVGAVVTFRQSRARWPSRPHDPRR